MASHIVIDERVGERPDLDAVHGDRARGVIAVRQIAIGVDGGRAIGNPDARRGDASLAFRGAAARVVTGCSRGQPA